MDLRYLGYACINLSLNKTTNKKFRLKNMNDDIIYTSIEYNLNSLIDILEWNVENNIYFFRIGSEIVPFASHEDFCFNWKEKFFDKLEYIKKMVIYNKIRLSMHPGQYTVLNSNNADVVSRAIREIDYHSEFLDSVCDGGNIIIHIGGVYDDKVEAMNRFIQSFYKLSEKSKKMLIIENDDKSYNISDVINISKKIKIPIVFDYFHHKCNPPKINYDMKEIICEILNSWDEKIPKFHLSSQKENTKYSHSDEIRPEDFYEFISLMNEINCSKVNSYDLMLEAKLKDKALVKLRRTQNKIILAP